MNTNEPTLAARLEAFAGLYTGAVADIMDDLGLREQCLPHDIRPLTPSTRLWGPVLPVRGRARHYDDGVDPRYRQMDMLDAIFPGCVLVMDPADETKAAHWGELMSTTAKAKGARGAVIAGGLRDTPQILDLGFPVFNRYHSPLTAVYRYDIAEIGTPIRLGGVPIAPGDWILGDIDGLLVIPAGALDDVIAKAREVKDKEDIVRASLKTGGNIRELFETYRVF